MAGRILLFLFITVVFTVLVAGCTAPAPSGTQESIPGTTVVPTPLPTVSVAEATPAPVEEATNLSANVTTVPVTVPSTPAQVTTTPGPSQQEIYYGNVVIYMDREGYALINFENLGYPILKPGDTFIVRITADQAILAYVIRSYDVPVLRTIDGTPTYNSYDRTYDYGTLSPIMKLENIYDGGGEFTVKDLGAYTLVLDTRLSTIDYHFVNQAVKVTVRVLKVD
jgi:hypothetical protein